MSNILETFFFLFEADASKLKDGLKDSEREADKLKDRVSDVDDAAKMVGGSLLKLATQVGAALGGFVAVATIKAAVLETAAAIDDLGDAAAALDIPVEDLHAWSMAATMVDGSQQGFITSLQTINTGLNAIATKGKGLMLPFLKELGLSMADVKTAAKDPLFALTKMSDAFSKLSKAEAAGLGAKLGLDQGTINLLAQGRRGLDELIAKQKEMGVVTAAQVEAAGKFDEQLKRNRATYEDIKRALVVSVLPSITWFLETLRKGIGWLRDNSGFVTAFFGAAATVLTVAYIPAMIRGAAATWALIAPWIAVGVAVAAFAAALGLVVDDLWNYLQGNESVIGELVKKWPLVGEVIDGIGTTLVALIEVVRAFGAFFVDLITQGPQKAIENFASAIDTLVTDISDRWPKVGEVFEGVGLAMGATIDGVAKAWTWLVDKIAAGVQFFKDAASFIGRMHGAGARALGFDIGNNPADAIAAGKQQIALTNTPLASQTSNSISNSRNISRSTTVQVGDVNVHTQATDAEGVGRAVHSTLGDQLKGAIDQHDDGVAA